MTIPMSRAYTNTYTNTYTDTYTNTNTNLRDKNKTEVLSIEWEQRECVGISVLVLVLVLVHRDNKSKRAKGKRLHIQSRAGIRGHSTIQPYSHTIINHAIIHSYNHTIKQPYYHTII